MYSFSIGIILKTLLFKWSQVGIRFCPTCRLHWNNRDHYIILITSSILLFVIYSQIFLNFLVTALDACRMRLLCLEVLWYCHGINYIFLMRASQVLDRFHPSSLLTPEYFSQISFGICLSSRARSCGLSNRMFWFGFPCGFTFF